MGVEKTRKKIIAKTSQEMTKYYPWIFSEFLIPRTLRAVPKGLKKKRRKIIIKITQYAP